MSYVDTCEDYVVMWQCRPPSSILHPTHSPSSIFNMAIIEHPTQTVLLIGSPRSVMDGTYTDLITKYDNQSPVKHIEKHLIDRISDGATHLSPSSFDTVHLVVELEDLSATPAPQSPSKLLRLILPSLKPAGNLIWTTKSHPSTIEAAFKESTVLLNVQATPSTNESQLITAIKSSSGTSSSVKINLPQKKNNKASLWSFTSDDHDVELIDDSTLLTEEDLKRPTNSSTTEACNPKKAKKACKNCTCGLRELELTQEDDLPAHLKPAGSDVPSKPTDPTKLVVGGASKNFTSSCGSCYLGDAFRCSSCPYLGMPAFEPGQEVKLTAEMGDDLQA